MIDLGEHIEAMGQLYVENELPWDPDSIAAEVLDIACAQGLLSEDEASSDLAHKECADQVRYTLGVD